MKRTFDRLLAVALTVSIMALIFVLAFTAGLASPTQAGPAPSAAPAPAADVVNVGSQIFAAIGITQNYTGSARYLPSYLADCYLTTVLTGTQDVTLTLQHSPDASTWVDLFAFDPIARADASQAITVVFTNSVQFYGTYVRGLATLTSNAPVNAKLICTYH